MQHLADDLDELYVTGSSPHEGGLSVSPAGSPLVVRTRAVDDESPPGSTVMPRQPLTRVSSGVMDIPGEADGEEDVRPPLVGPSQLPQLAAAAYLPVSESPVLCQDAAPKFDTADGSGTPRKFGPNDFSILSLVGQGAFGKVFQVQRRDDGRIFALKVMKKSVVLEKQQTEYMRTERDVLTRVVHPYIVTLHASFQTPNKLYLVLDFINGGHLFFQLYRAGIFDEPLARIYAAEIVLALKHLHEQGIVHRDLKARPLGLHTTPSSPAHADAYSRRTSSSTRRVTSASQTSGWPPSSATAAGTTRWLAPSTVRLPVCCLLAVCASDPTLPTQTWRPRSLPGRAIPRLQTGGAWASWSSRCSPARPRSAQRTGRCSRRRSSPRR